MIHSSQRHSANTCKSMHEKGTKLVLYMLSLKVLSVHSVLVFSVSLHILMLGFLILDKNSQHAILWTACIARKMSVKNLLCTLFGETFNAKSREDTRARGIRPHLHLQRNPDGHSYFKLDAPYVLTKQDQTEFLTTLRELKFPSNYVGALSRRIQDGKLRGLKTHDFHILLQQVIPLCFRNVGHPKVVGAVMRVSRLFKKISVKVVDVESKNSLLRRLLKQFAL